MNLNLKNNRANTDNNNSSSLLKGLVLSILILIFLSAYSYLYEQSTFLQRHFKQIHVLPFQKDTLERSLTLLNYQKLVNQKNNLLVIKRQKQIEDSLKAAAEYKGPKEGLLDFFNALDQIKNSSCRIAYFGDSMIEGDLMSMSLREMLQNKYGGQGIGYMPITSATNQFRMNIIHDFSKTWTMKSLLNFKDLEFPLGISGKYFIADTTAQENTVYYGARNLKFVNSFPKTKLFYGKSDSINFENELVFNGQNFILDGDSEVNTLVLSKDTLKQVELNFKMKSIQPIYGVSFESDSGVLLDNFSLRGNTGIPMSVIEESVLKSFNDEFGYDLIILQFGLNVISNETNYAWYRMQMIRTIKHFQSAIPNASILMVSVPDVSQRDENGEMHTNISVIPILEAQKKAAMQTKVSFFNLFEAMGGEDSMVKWVEELEYANKDYMHFNFKGARYASELLFEFLEQEYQTYKNSKSIE